ncbi:2-amino-4-hydroxy-6-hydroxymethyldihydropteridine diphosphokinase [bacterium]|nr:2-amino-4-hydroxy-6-hydroxymethyldihydropteridine diphosphokinase [bacterium]
MKSYILSLGSNIGNSIGYLRDALLLLEERGVTVVERSSMYKTSPVDYHNQSDFVNMIALVEFSSNPFDLLSIISAVEDSLGRERAIDRGPRTVDIDIVAAEGIQIEHPRLSLPHPRAKKRKFVMQPIQEIAERDGSSSFIRKTAAWKCSFLGNQTIEKMEE